MQIIILRSVQAGLAEGAAKLNSQAGSLHLIVRRAQQPVSSGGNGNAQHESTFSACKNAVAVTAHAAIEVFEKLRRLQAKLTQQAELPRNESRLDLTTSAAVTLTEGHAAHVPPQVAAQPQGRRSSEPESDRGEPRQLPQLRTPRTLTLYPH